MKNIKNMQKKYRDKIKTGALTLSMWLPMQAMASQTKSDLPWESTLDTISQSIQGPVLMSVSIIMFITTMVMLAFGEWGDIFKSVIKVTAVLSLCFSVTSLITTLFGSGAVF